MLGALNNLFASVGFEPHGHCFLWDKTLLQIYVVSDSMIALSYYLIPVALVIFVRKRKDLAFNWIFLMFSAFIFACGTTHILGVLTLWQPVYWLDGTVKALTAGISLTTAMMLWPLLPKALAIPSPTQLEVVNRQLKKQIAERETAVEQLRHSEERFRLLVESAPDAMVIIDVAGKITLVNTRAEQLFGFSREEVLGLSTEILIPERFKANHQEHLASFLESPRQRPIGAAMELYAIRKDGREFPVEIMLSPIQTDDGIVITSAIRDISERKEAERLLRDRERLAMLGLSAAVFAHETANPLNGLGASIELAQSILKETDSVDPLVLRTLKIASLEVGRLTSLLKDYRSFARPPQLNLEPTDIAHLVQEVLAPAMWSYSASAIKVAFEFEDDLPPVKADSEKIKQVVLNLCKNAADAMPDGGVLTCTGYKRNDRAVLEISDTGCGISDDIDVFQLFKTTKADGTGLGLPIVQQIITEHNGTIDYVSTPGNGTTFRVSLPLYS
jgi:two-component system, LuxR family, sensor kinase FixL